MEKNRIKLKICGATYSIITEDDENYVLKLGETIDEEMGEISAANPTLSLMQCAVLVALDQADACQKATASADNLRAQIKDYLEDSARARMEVDVARREIERLNREISNLREKLSHK
ncbi:MAG: cell division protein ZapA [Clostridiales bacterium]|nr:cell division protein ZapA [Clostridiales bacterium]